MLLMMLPFYDIFHILSIPYGHQIGGHLVGFVGIVFAFLVFGWLFLFGWFQFNSISFFCS